MTEKTDPKKYMGYLKDAVYVISIIVAVGGWLISKSQNEAILKTTVENNTESLNKLELFIDEQAELNGKIIQYMIMDSN